MTDADKIAVVAFLRRQRDQIDAEIARLLADDDPLAEEIARLSARCRELGIAVNDGMVSPYDAARLIEAAPQTLANRRTRGEPPDHVKLPANRIAYRLDDLARYRTSR